MGFTEAVEGSQFDLIELECVRGHFLRTVEPFVHGLPQAPDDQDHLVFGLVQLQLDFDVQAVLLLADGLGSDHSMCTMYVLLARQHHGSPDVGLAAKVEDSQTPAVSELEHSVDGDGPGDQDEIESIFLLRLSHHHVGVVEEKGRMVEVVLKVGLDLGNLLDKMEVEQQVETLRAVSVEPLLDFEVRPENHQLML